MPWPSTLQLDVTAKPIFKHLDSVDNKALKLLIFGLQKLGDVGLGKEQHNYAIQEICKLINFIVNIWVIANFLFFGIKNWVTHL